jgi:hypothetical protein
MSVFSTFFLVKLRLQWAEIGAENRKIGKKVVTMQPKIGSRKTGPEIGKRKCGYNERFFDFRTRFSENRVFRKMWLQ